MKRSNYFFLSAIGSKHYVILRCLIDNRQEEKTFEQSCMLMERHNNPALNAINEYFLINTKDKKDGQSITEYGTTVKKKFEYSSDWAHTRSDCCKGKAWEDLWAATKWKKVNIGKNLEIAVFMESYKVFKRIQDIQGISINESETLIHRLSEWHECNYCGSIIHLAYKWCFKYK